jgi:glycosyltransferase involved in cell wall biosynthesis
MRRLSAHNGFDVLHLHAWSRPTVLQAALAGRAPMLFTPHGAFVGPSARTSRAVRVVQAGFDRVVAKRLLARMSLVHALTEYQAALLTRSWGVPPSRLVVQGPPLADEARSPRPGTPGGRGRYLAMARLSREKRVPDVLGALAARHELAPCDVVGPEENDIAEVRRMAGRLDPDRVAFLGVVTGPERLDLLRGATALLLPSEFEGLSITALEALAQGTPVVASATASRGLPTAAILVFPTGDVSALADRMHEVADPAVRDRLSSAASEAAASFPSPASHAAFLVAAYRRMGQSGPTGGQ